MTRGRKSNLNESGEMFMTRIVRGAALHVSRAEQTLLHSHYAWKVHVGVDAPVWFDSASLVVERNAGARVVIVPPGVEHRIGSLGLSLTILVAPGTRSTAWRASDAPALHQGATAQRIVEASHAWQFQTRADTDVFISELLGFALTPNSAAPRIDARVRRALGHLSREPDTQLEQLAHSERVSLDRLSHLVVQDTGTRLKSHALWSRVTRLLSSDKRFTSVAAAAADGGFSDHAHMTRTYRAMLGRLPSEFTGPPDVVAPWASV